MTVKSLVTRLREGTHGTDIAKTDAYLDSIMAQAADRLETSEETIKELTASLAARTAAVERLSDNLLVRNTDINELRGKLREIVQYANLYGIRDEGDGYALVRIAKQALEGPRRAG